MIVFKKENILNVRAEVLINSVNLKGVMGKGVALAFKNAFPENYKLYKKACENGNIDIGKIFVTETHQLFPKFIVNFPTKKHWRFPSKYEYIKLGMEDLVKWIKKENIKSIAIPPLGSGNGKLDWIKVKKIIIRYLNTLQEDLEIVILEPNPKFAVAITKKVNKPKLTPARAMLIYLMNKYRVLGYEVNFLVAQKLVYFLQRFEEPLKLRFSKGYYGPYAQNLVPVLNLLNGYYIKFKYGNDNKPSTNIKIEQSRIEEVNYFVKNNLTKDQKERLNKSLEFISGFETPFGLELLGTIDFILLEKNNLLSTKEILDELKYWTKRKQNLFKPFYIEKARERLIQHFKYEKAAN